MSTAASIADEASDRGGIGNEGRWAIVVGAVKCITVSPADIKSTDGVALLFASGTFVNVIAGYLLPPRLVFGRGAKLGKLPAPGR